MFLMILKGSRSSVGTTLYGVGELVFKRWKWRGTDLERWPLDGGNGVMKGTDLGVNGACRCHGNNVLD